MMNSSNQHQIHAVLFDLGSTLIYFDANWAEITPQMNQALLDALRRAGFLTANEGFIARFRAQLNQFLSQGSAEFHEYTWQYVLTGLLKESGYPDVTESQVAPVLKEMFTVSQVHWKAEPDAIPTLSRLRQLGYRLGIVSNAGDDADVQTLIDQAGIREYFDVIQTSAAAGVRKPNPRIFHMVLDRMGVEPAQAIMVGDTLGADILGAHNAGMPGIWITRRADRVDNRSHEDTIQPDAVVDSLDEVVRVVDEVDSEIHGIC